MKKVTVGIIGCGTIANGAHIPAYMKNEDDVDFVETLPAMTGEDFGYLISKIPGTMFWLGVDSPYSLHSEYLAPKEESIMLGVNAITGYLKNRQESLNK